MDVEWADITKAEGDAFVVGHYIGVLPQNAEWALDCALSRTKETSRLLLTDLTRRGAIRGALGDLNFFPWTGGRQIVLAGMGRSGMFRESQLKTLARNVVETIGRLLSRPNICMVLIGSGYGNLEVEQSVAGLLDGIDQARAADPALEIGRVRIVERDLDRSYEILEALRTIARDRSLGIDVAPEVVERDSAGGVIPVPFGLSLMLASLAQACREGAGSPLHATVETLVAELPEQSRDKVRERLASLGDERNPRRLGLEFRFAPKGQEQDKEIADRVGFSQDGAKVRATAITNMTTVTARDLDVPLAWVDRIVEDLHAPLPDRLTERSVKAYRYLVHQDLKDSLQGRGGPLVLEVDRSMARVPWEMIHDDGLGSLPLAVQRPLARQLRTSYSPRSGAWGQRAGVRALVIGDPDGSLEYARKEARSVATLLEQRGITVDFRLGSADELGLGRYGAEPAELFEILALLQSGNFDLVHYSGHAAFYPESPDRSGWLFANGEILTASRLENVDRPPRLIVANACISAALSTQHAEVPVAARPGPVEDANAAGGAHPPPDPKPRRPGDARIVASLADEFFRRGVADYIGTAWEVPEGPAEMFALKFYETLLGKGEAGAGHGTGRTLGEAVQAARRELWDKRTQWPAELQTVWAAYQHYGDPTRGLRD